MNIEIYELPNGMIKIYRNTSGLEITVCKKYINNFKKLLKQTLENHHNRYYSLTEIYNLEFNNIGLGNGFLGNYILDAEIEAILNLLDKKYKPKRIRIDTLNKSKLDKLDFEDLVYVYNKIKERK